MAMKFTVGVNGAEEVAGQLDRMSPAARTRLALALREACKGLRKEMRLRTPRDKGKFRKSIRSKFTRDKLTATTGAYSQKGRRIHPLTHIIEFGTAPHTIGPERPGGKAIKFADGELRYGVTHPGTSATPFLVPAYEVSAPAIVDALRDGLGLAVADAEMGRTVEEPPDTDDDS